MHFRNSAIVHNKIIGGDNWAAFFEIFDFALIAFTDFETSLKGRSGRMATRA